MKRSLLTLGIILSLIMGCIPTMAASPVKPVINWAGDYSDENWIGVNVTTLDGKTNPSKRLFKGDARYLAVAGDWVYFLKQDPDSDVVAGDIMRMKKDGTGLAQVTKGNRVSRFSIDGQTIYYGAYDDNYDNQLKSMKLDGSASKIVIKKLSFWSYLAVNGTLFYVDTAGDGRLYSMKFDGKGKTAISKGKVDPYEGYKLYDGVLYYSEYEAQAAGGKGYLVDLNGKNKVTISSKASIRPISYQKQLFYYEEATLGKDGNVTALTLVQIKRDGTQKKTIAKLAVGDQFIGQQGTTFLYKTASNKFYTVK